MCQMPRPDLQMNATLQFTARPGGSYFPRHELGGKLGMALGNSDRMSCGLTHCPHVDRLLMSSSLLPECPPQQRRRERYQTLSKIHHMSAGLQSRSSSTK